MIRSESQPELSRLLPVRRLGSGDSEFLVEADTAECAAIARRLHIPAVHSLACRFSLHRDGSRVAARGVLQAVVVQDCVVSLEAFESELREDFEVVFVPSGSEANPEDDLLGLDEVPYENGIIDLGEATVEQLALGLDPYPRRPDATLPSADPREEPEHPFAALARRRPR